MTTTSNSESRHKHHAWQHTNSFRLQVLLQSVQHARGHCWLPATQLGQRCQNLIAALLKLWPLGALPCRQACGSKQRAHLLNTAAAGAGTGGRSQGYRCRAQCQLLGKCAAAAHCCHCSLKWSLLVVISKMRICVALQDQDACCLLLLVQHRRVQGRARSVVGRICRCTIFQQPAQAAGVAFCSCPVQGCVACR